MDNTVEFQARIEKTRSQIERDYKEAFQTVKKLKNKMNKLEQNIIHKERTQTTQDLNALDMAIKRLNKLTDLQISRSKKAWENCRKLEHDCEQYELRPIQLDNLRVLCKKMEELAADLLCYSLGRFKPSEQ